MELHKICIALLALLLAAMVIIPIVSAAEQKSNTHPGSEPGIVSIKPTAIDINDAESVALSQVRLLAENNPKFSNWTNAAVNYATTYYDLNDEKSAYLFNVVVDNKYSGYVLISATRENFPILAFSHSEIPGSGTDVAKKTMNVAKEGSTEKDLTPVKEKTVYLGGLSFYDEYQMIDSKGQNKRTTFVDIHTNRIVDLSNTSQSIPIPASKTEFEKFQERKQNEIKESWDSMDQGLSTTVTVRSATSYTWNSLNGVPQYFWTQGCSPTAAAMVVGYYSLHGYPNLPIDTTLINELASYMGTTVGGSTWPWDIATGINTLLSNHNYNTLTASTDVIPTWSGDVNEIDSIRPFVLNMLAGQNAIGRSQAYGDHSVTCIGYTGNTGSADQQFLEVYDTWMVSGESNYVSHFIHYNNWGWAANTYVRPS
jgi:hypothetical protein